MKKDIQVVQITAKEHEMLVSIAQLISDAHAAEKYPEFAREFNVSAYDNIEKAKIVVQEYEEFFPPELPQ